MHDALTIGIPVFVIFIGILFNRADFTRMEARMQALETRLEGRMDKLQSELNSLRNEMHSEFREFYRTMGQHDARLDNLERDRK